MTGNLLGDGVVLPQDIGDSDTAGRRASIQEGRLEDGGVVGRGTGLNPQKGCVVPKQSVDAGIHGRRSRQRRIDSRCGECGDGGVKLGLSGAGGARAGHRNRSPFRYEWSGAKGNRADASVGHGDLRLTAGTQTHNGRKGRE